MGGEILSYKYAKAYVKPGVTDMLRVASRLGYASIPGGAQRLTSWMVRMVRGNAADERTPLYEGVSRDDVKSGLVSAVEKSGRWSNPNIAPGYPDAYTDVEAGQAKNWGPQSVFVPWEVDMPAKVHAVMSYKPIPVHDERALEKALDYLANKVVVPKSLRQTSLTDAIKGWGGDPRYALDDSKNSCIPGYVSGWGRVSGEDPSSDRVRAYKDLVERARGFVEANRRCRTYTQNLTEYAGTAAQRTVQKGKDPLHAKETNYKNKRLVIAMPKDETIVGKMLFTPVQQALLKYQQSGAHIRLMAGWLPMPRLDRNVDALLRQAAANNRVVWSGDISSFDASVPPELYWRVALAVSNWFEPESARLFQSMLYSDIFQTGVVTPEGYIRPVASSMKSGSMFTNLMDSMINYTCMLYGHFAGYYELVAAMVNGDDGLADGPGVSGETMERAFAEMGFSANAEKAFIRPFMCHYLQKLYVCGVPGGQGSVFRVGGNMLSVEDDTQLKYDERNEYSYAFQALARLENAVFNPEFETLVQFMRVGSSNQLGASVPVNRVLSGAGEYVERVLETAKIKPWTAVGSGVPFSQWACNRVLRGAKLPPIGKARWENYYQRRWERTPL